MVGLTSRRRRRRRRLVGLVRTAAPAHAPADDIYDLQTPTDRPPSTPPAPTHLSRRPRFPAAERSESPTPFDVKYLVSEALFPGLNRPLALWRPAAPTVLFPLPPLLLPVWNLLSHRPQLPLYKPFLHSRPFSSQGLTPRMFDC